MPWWNPPSSLLVLVPSPAYQSAGTNTETPQAKQLARQGHSSTHEQAHCLKTPSAHSVPTTLASHSPHTSVPAPAPGPPGPIPANGLTPTPAARIPRTWFLIPVGQHQPQDSASTTSGEHQLQEHCGSGTYCVRHCPPTSMPTSALGYFGPSASCHRIWHHPTKTLPPQNLKPALSRTSLAQQGTTRPRNHRTQPHLPGSQHLTLCNQLSHYPAPPSVAGSLNKRQGLETNPN